MAVEHTLHACTSISAGVAQGALGAAGVRVGARPAHPGSRHPCQASRRIRGRQGNAGELAWEDALLAQQLGVFPPCTRRRGEATLYTPQELRVYGLSQPNVARV